MMRTSLTNGAAHRASPDEPGSASRRLPIGAEILAGGGGVHFRVWAPASSICAIELLGETDQVIGTHALTEEAGGYFSGTVSTAHTGSRYKVMLDHGSFPDPASRFQPAGPHGPSLVVDHHFPWSDHRWTGRPADDWVVYELHLGTFTPAGTWAAAQEKLEDLARLGVTVLEVMPIADFPGRFGWGYDGVDLFAPSRLYGQPNDARAFINRAHDLGLMVILDVVYNHVGPDGNYLKNFAPDYFSSRYANEWGEPLNFDGANSGPVREFFRTNARYWIEEFHFDGLRLDATQQIFDASPRHILAEVTAAVRAAAGQRETLVVGENECQHARLVRPASREGYGLDALWNDDFHHAARVAATGRAEAYYSGYTGQAQEFVSCAKYGFLYQGQWFSWQKGRRGRPAFDLSPLQFVAFLQNHDQVANSLRGERLDRLASPAKVRALTALLLLGRSVPMLFQGQEFGASSPFLYFADHKPELAQLVRDGRENFLRQFPSIASPEAAALLPDPAARATFERSKLDWSERTRNGEWLQLHADLLALRRSDAAVRAPRRLDGAVLAEHAFVLRYFAANADDGLLVVNLGDGLRICTIAEPLLAPREDSGWRVVWSSESPAYGGAGTPPLETKDGWILPAASAVWLKPDPHAEPVAAKLSQKD